MNDAVDDFHADLSDEQKTQFEGLGPKKRGYDFSIPKRDFFNSIGQ